MLAADESADKGADKGEEFQVGGAELLEDWPSEIPIHPDLNIQTAAKDVENGKNIGWNARWKHVGTGK